VRESVEEVRERLDENGSAGAWMGAGGPSYFWHWGFCSFGARPGIVFWVSIALITSIYNYYKKVNC